MTPEAFRAELDRLALNQGGAARLLDVDDRTIRRWSSAEKPVPRAVELLLPKLSPREVARLIGSQHLAAITGNSGKQ